MQWQRTFTFGAYTSNKAGFTLKYCENITKPMLKCQGMCHLKKLLTEQNEEDKGKSTTEAEFNIYLYQEKCETYKLFLPLFQVNLFSGSITQTAIPFKNLVFRPPAG